MKSLNFIWLLLISNIYGTEHGKHVDKREHHNDSGLNQPFQQHQLQRQLLVGPSNTQKMYESIFLDDFEKLLIQGKNEEAAQLAAHKENEGYDIINKRLDKNKALTYAQVSKDKYRKNIDIDERFSKSYFRIYTGDTQKLIDDYEKNITALEDEYKKRQFEIEQLEHKKKTHKKDLLKAEIDEDYRAVTKLINEIIQIASKHPELKDIDLTDLETFQKEYANVYEMVTKKSDKLDSNLIKDLEHKLYEKVISRGWGNKKPIDRVQQHVTTLSKEEQSILWALIDIFKYKEPNFLEKIKTWLVTDPNIYLDKTDEERLKALNETWSEFKKDTEMQIAAQMARINFIKSNPTFFKLKVRPRAVNLGIDHPEYWVSDEKSPLKLGKGVTVGVIDSFDTCKQKSTILHKSVNPDFVGKGCTLNIGGTQRNDHGLNVAGIIVSDLIEKGNPPMTVGVAPHARFEMLSYQSLDCPTSKANSSSKIEWTVDRMANAITQLAHTGSLSELGLSMNMVTDNPITNSSAPIFNWSMATSNLGQFGRMPITEFEGDNLILVLVKLLQSKLLVIAAGNDGADVSASKQFRLDKALASSPATQSHMIWVTNLMQDGLTLHPSSNLPGSNAFLQARTLSAPGTGIIGIKLMESEDSPTFENDIYGTSMAAPHVSGVAAVVLSNYPSLTPKELADCLLEGATPLLINDEGNTYELADITMSELSHMFNKSHEPDVIKISGQSIKRIDWTRGKEAYGQGRVSLKGALATAREKDLT